MAKLTGKKKAEFLARMARGRKKAGRATNPKRRPAAKKKKARKARTKAAGNPKSRKLTGAKKAEFLKRMARGRRAAGSAGNPKRKTKKSSPTRKAKRFSPKGKQRTRVNGKKKRRRNPDDLAGAEQLYEQFHGKPPANIREYELPYHYPQNFAELGTLKELRVFLDNANPEFALTRFGDCRVVATPDGNNIYFVGGDQSVDLAALDIASDKDDVDLGPCVYICYHATKGFHDFAPIDYYHQFGEETGVFPRLSYNRLNERLYLVSGDYRVKPEGIVN